MIPVNLHYCTETDIVSLRISFGLIDHVHSIKECSTSER